MPARTMFSQSASGYIMGKLNLALKCNVAQQGGQLYAIECVKIQKRAGTSDLSAVGGGYNKCQIPPL